MSELLSYSYKFFGGLNLRDDPTWLKEGRTPRAQNNELVLTTGLSNKLGIADEFPGQKTNTHWDGRFYYEDKNESPSYIAVSYPNVYIVDNATGFPELIYDKWFSGGTPSLVPSVFGEALLVDGANPPLHIVDRTATPLAWPPAYTSNNKDVLANSIYAQEDNPTTLGDDIGYPSFGIFAEGRYILSGDRIAPTRLYESKIGSVNFSDNSGSGIDVAFFLNIFSNSRITGLEILSNQAVVIFCENEIFIQSGTYAPRVNAPVPIIQIKPLDREIGCVGLRAFAKSNNSDLFFLSSKKTLYTLSSSENFQDARPLGISEIIYPALSKYTRATLSRSILVNDKLKGELQIWLPEDNDKYYPNTRYIYSYAETKQEAEWSFDTGLNVDVNNVFVDKSNSKVIISDISKLLVSDSGNSYNGKDINLVYQLAPVDFGERDVIKQLHHMIVYYRLFSEEPINLSFEYAWDDAISQIETVRLEPVTTAKYGEALFGDPRFRYGSGAGEAIQKVVIPIGDSQGDIFQVTIKASGKFQLFLSELRFRYSFNQRSSI